MEGACNAHNVWSCIMLLLVAIGNLCHILSLKLEPWVMPNEFLTLLGVVELLKLKKQPLMLLC